MEKMAGDIGNPYDVLLKMIDTDEYAIYIKGTHVGNIDVRFGEEDAVIENIDIFPLLQRKGYGTQVVSFIKRLPLMTIYGEAVPDTLSFWVKMGARYAESVLEQYVSSSDEQNTPRLIPFRISLG